METYVREIELDLSKERHDEVHEIVGNTIVNLTPEYEIYIKLDDPTNQPINLSYIQKLTNASFSRLYITNSKQEGTAKLLVGANFDVDLIPRYIDEINTVLTDGFTRIVTKTGIDQMQDGEVLYTMIQQTTSEVSVIATKLNYTPDDPENWSQQYAAISATYDKIMSVVNTLDKVDAEAEEQFSVIKQLANKIRFETVKITSTELREVYLELDNEGKIVLSADKVVIDGNAIVTGAIDGNLIRAHTIKADHIESSLWGDLNQAMLYVKTMMSEEGETNIVPSYAELVAGTYEGFYVTSDAKLKLYTQKYWDDGVTRWDDGSTWDIPTVTSAYWESPVFDLGQEYSGQINLTFVYNSDDIGSFTFDVYFSYYDSSSGSWSTWIRCRELRASGSYKMFVSDIQTFRKFKIKINVTTNETNHSLDIYNMLISFNMINVPGHGYMNIPINDGELNLYLNADTVDGLHATDFVQQDSVGNVNISGNLTVSGDLTVQNAIKRSLMDYQYYTVLDLTGLDPDTWYPVVFGGNGHGGPVKIEIQRNDIHQDGSHYGTLHFVGTFNSSGWGSSSQQYWYRYYEHITVNLIPWIGRQNHGYDVIVYLRGGRHYYVCHNTTIKNKNTIGQPFANGTSGDRYYKVFPITDISVAPYYEKDTSIRNPEFIIWIQPRREHSFVANRSAYIEGNLYVTGNVGIGTKAPSEKLHVMGNVKANAFLTGDIIMHKDNKPVWRLYEDENGIYAESLITGKKYRIMLEEAKD